MLSLNTNPNIHVAIAHSQSVVLENLSHLYTHPSIMDVKLGTVLAGPDATPEKQARMEAQAKGSTSWEMGIRLTGCQVSHHLLHFWITTLRPSFLPRWPAGTDGRHGTHPRRAISSPQNHTARRSPLRSCLRV